MVDELIARLSEKVLDLLDAVQYERDRADHEHAQTAKFIETCNAREGEIKLLRKQIADMREAPEQFSREGITFAAMMKNRDDMNRAIIMADHLKQKYHELLMAVQSKRGDEERHDTALRYIREGEERKAQIQNAVESRCHEIRP